MGLVDKLYRNPPPPGHPLQVSDRAANAIKKIMREQGIVMLQDYCVVIDVTADLNLIMNIYDADDHVGSPQFAHAVIKFLHVSIPVEKAAMFEGTWLDYDDVGKAFAFRGGMFDTQASDPGNITPSKTKMAKLCPNVLPTQSNVQHGPYENVAVSLRDGDSRAALVARIAPLVVAAYSDELDAVALLQFPSWLVDQYQLKVGTKLLTVNTYERGNIVAPDLKPGPLFKESFCNFIPLIAEFLTDDIETVMDHQSNITDTEWNRLLTCIKAATTHRTHRYRNGIPPNSGKAIPC